MKIEKRSLSAALALCVALAACGGGGGGIGTALPKPQPPGGGSSPSAGVTYGAGYLKGASLMGPAAFGTLSVDVYVQMKDEAGLMQYAQAASNPNSAAYRQFLTPGEIADRFGATQTDYKAVADYFAQNGLYTGGWPQREILHVMGAQGNLEKALGVKFGIYEQNGKQFIAPMTAPHFPITLPVRGISGVVTADRNFRQFVPVSAGAGVINGYGPQQLAKVFDYVGAYNAGYTGSGINIGIIGTGPISALDVPAYGTLLGAPVAAVVQVNALDANVSPGNPSVPGFGRSKGLQSPPPVTRPCSGGLPSCNPEDVEAQIDTEQAAALAPGSTVLFYLAYNPGECFQPGGPFTPGQACPAPGSGVAGPQEGLALSDDEIQQAIADNNADILSLSYGGGEILNAGGYFDAGTHQGFGPTEFATLAAMGVAVFASSGDSGAQGCQRPAVPGSLNSQCTSYPATDPSVTSVGGVTTPMDQFGNLTNQLTAWGIQTTGGQGGSGGGVSNYFPVPAWQAGAIGIVGSTRNQPDASLEADASTGVAVVTNAGTSLGGRQVSQFGGTSVAAPEMAAMWALVLQACKQTPACIAKGSGTHPYRLGIAAAQMFQIYKSSTLYSSTFYDVVFGNNGQLFAGSPSPGPTPTGGLDPGFNAGVGFDLVTGIGVPFGRNLIKAVVGV
ncbi:MAG: S53 family peptidase [Vulcanimicrobiaceae bacterium]